VWPNMRSIKLSRPCGQYCKVFESKESEHPSNGTKSLYERLGGIYAITLVINDFSDALIKNPIVGENSPNPNLRDWHRHKLNRLPGLKFMRSLWVADISGGPLKFVSTMSGKCPLSLEKPHERFRISPIEFDAVAQELKKSLQKYSVPEREMNEVLQAFGAHKNEVNTGFFLANNLSVPPVVCSPSQFQQTNNIRT
jgi:hemoglobin